VEGSIEGYLLLGFALSIVATGGALACAAFVLVRLPADYFCAPAPRVFLAGTHPLVRRTARFLKNVLGAGFVGLGILLSLPGIPGPGIVTVLIGVVLLDFPAKRPLKRWLISRPLILRTINRLRLRYGKPPLAAW
jgi:hypothetical protein